MRVRDHVLLSTGAAALLYPWLRGKVVIPWAASVLIDVDHYLWFCAQTRSMDPREAVRFYTGAKPPQHAGTRLLHHPLALALLFVLARKSRLARLAVMGMVFHVSLDAYHAARTAAARTTAMQRDVYTCQRCGAIASDIVAHQWHQPPMLPSYSPDFLTSLCGKCHEEVHAQGLANELIAPLPAARARSGAGPQPRVEPVATSTRAQTRY